MRKEVVLITGAAGEMGQALIHLLSERGVDNILAIDVRPVPKPLRSRCRAAIMGDILDENLFGRLVSEYAIPVIYHLAALLSTRAEFTPEAAHRVNVNGTLNLLKLAADQSSWLGKPVKFMFPSSVAVYGLPDLETKEQVGAVKEEEWNQPTTMYGCNKLYCEHLGRYYAHYYRQLAAEPPHNGVDFRSIRFPGLISAFTVPSGGTSDYGPEMLHHAAQGKPYACFVREDTRMPFMAMPDALKALMTLELAPRDALTTHVYNVTSFNPSAGEILERVKAAFPDAQVTFEPDLKRQAIVDSWPIDQDDSRARRDWGWQPDYDLDRAFDEYLIPNIQKRYAAV
ncbi:MAG TPA: NAD-dependent epimerase/dehydratase family protein [Chloroflexi bacterium]|nr:NAD-dependent epimerase/dehydratase family protein [Chloroflexota bacterium]